MKELVVEPTLIGVAACGGGATGSQQIGPLEVMEEHNIIPDIGIANSVGAINLGEFFGSGFKTQRLREDWLAFKKPSEIFDPDPYQIARTIVAETTALLINAVSKSLNLGQHENTKAADRLSRLTTKIINLSGPSYKLDPLIKIVRKINVRNIVTLPQEFLVTVVNRQLRKTTFISNHDPEIMADPVTLRLFILASCAIPGLFPLIPIRYRGNEHEFYDAGCNIPLPLLQLTNRGCNTIIVLRCHSDEFNQTLPDGKIHQLVANALDATKRLEKNEIRDVKRMQDINLFVIQHKIPWPRSYNTVSFRPEDHRKAVSHMREVALEELDPLIRYLKQYPRNNTPQAISA